MSYLSIFIFTFFFFFFSFNKIVCAEDPAAWYDTLAIRTDDPAFYYDSNLWFNASTYNANAFATKSSKTAAYSSIYVQKISVNMAGAKKAYTFDLPDNIAGKLTLMQLVTMDGGISLTPSNGAPLWVSKI